MSRILTKEEIDALLANRPVTELPERIRIGDEVEVTIDGETVAYGRLASEHGRLTVRIHSLGKAGATGAAGAADAAEELNR